MPSAFHHRILLGMDGLTASPELLALLRDFEIGGVMLFKRNVESPAQVAALIREIQVAGNGRLVIAIDHEGGRVQRLAAPFTALPKGERVGRAGSTELAYALGRLAARELSLVGVNLNFAPVVDVWHPRNTVIGDRAYGSETDLVGRVGAAFIEGHQSGGSVSSPAVGGGAPTTNSRGVAACAKHFPGHGATLADSHFELPRDDRSLEDFRASDLPPFRRAIEAGVATIMTAHVEIPAVDARPATLSSRWIREILREELGFKGAVLSDDVEMKALSQSRDPAESAREAFEAGCDVVLVASGSAAAHREWLGALSARPPEIPPADIEASDARVEALKTRWVYGRPLPDPQEAASRIPDDDGERLVAQIHAAAELA